MECNYNNIFFYKKKKDDLVPPFLKAQLKTFVPEEWADEAIVPFLYSFVLGAHFSVAVLKNMADSLLENISRKCASALSFLEKQNSPSKFLIEDAEISHPSTEVEMSLWRIESSRSEVLSIGRWQSHPKEGTNGNSNWHSSNVSRHLIAETK